MTSGWPDILGQKGVLVFPTRDSTASGLTRAVPKRSPGVCHQTPAAQQPLLVLLSGIDDMDPRW
jgi:hypothetical protein